MESGESRGGGEKRAHRRHRIDLQKSLQLDGKPIPIMDISWGGVCFYSSENHEPGAEVHFFNDDLQVAATVLACAMGGEEPAHEEFPYKVRCQFLHEPHHPEIVSLMETVLEEEFGRPD